MNRDPSHWANHWAKLLVVVALFGATGTASLVSRAQAQAPAHGPAGGGAWEYRNIFRERGWHTKTTTRVLAGVPIPSNGYWYEFEPWTTYDGETQLPAGTDVKALIARLGSEGWELVSVTPISSFAGQSFNGSDDTAVAGATTEMSYWLKRPRR
jgi:hypothetical protein